MKSSRFTPLLVALPLAAALFTSCGKKTDDPVAPTTGSFAIEMEPVVGADDLVLNAQTYTNAAGQSYTVSKFKFLASNIKLTKADGTAYSVPDGYYLLDASTPTSLHFVIDNVPLGDYSGISFVVGVDAAHNNATYTSGGLNHSNDLYWEWSNEYVFLKMAGTSPQASTGRALTFDIGGANAARTVSPSFNGGTLGVKTGHTPEVHMSVNVAGLFTGTTPANNINFATTYSVESGSTWAPIIADNYAASMFAVEHIHAN